MVGAIEAAERALSREGNVHSLGDIVHNRVEVQRLERLGLRHIEHAALGEMRGGTVLIRAHGEPPSTYHTAERNGTTLIDATCPVVAKLQGTVRAAHAKMVAMGGQVVILGKKGHAEVVGLAGQPGGEVIVIEGMGDLGDVDFSRPIYLLSQTTQSLSLFREVSAEIGRRAADPAAVTIHDTICRQVAGRESHLREFAARFDTVIFVSGRKSSNGKALYAICEAANPASRFVEDETELRSEWFAGVGSAGVCGATSTPRWLMERVAECIAEICR